MFSVDRPERVVGNWQPTVAVVLFLIVVATIYWPGLSGELVIDDLPNLQPFGDYASGAIGWRDLVFGNDSGPLGRPLAMASLLLDFNLGGGSVFQFKLTNLILHLLCGVLLYVISVKLFSTPGRCPGGQRHWLAFAVVAVWSSAPLFASTVLYVIQRMAQLSALFSLLGLMLYLLGRSRMIAGQRNGVALLLLAYLAAWPAAILSKENGVLLPALLFVVESVWFKFEAPTSTRRKLVWIHVVFFAAPSLVGVVWGVMHFDRIIDSYAGRSFTLPQRLLTESRALWDYFFQLLLPDGLRMGVVQDDYPISQSLGKPVTSVISIAAWAGLLLLLVAFRRYPAVSTVSFGFWFYLCGHLLESTILPLELYFEHRNYLPATGLLIGLVGALSAISQNRIAPTKLLSVLIPVAALYLFVTYQRVVTWQSAEAIARVAETSHPRSPRLQTALVSIYARDGDLNRAIQHVRRLADLTGGRTIGHALHELTLYCSLRHAPTVDEFEKIRETVKLGTGVYDTERFVAFADTLRSTNCEGVRLEELRDWFMALSGIVKSSGDWMLVFQLARVFEMLGNPGEAISLLDIADTIDPTRLEPRLIKIRLFIAAGDRDAARRVLVEVEKGLPKAVNYQRELIETYRQQLKKN